MPDTSTGDYSEHSRSCWCRWQPQTAPGLLHLAWSLADAEGASSRCMSNKATPSATMSGRRHDRGDRGGARAADVETVARRRRPLRADLDGARAGVSLIVPKLGGRGTAGDGRPGGESAGDDAVRSNRLRGSRSPAELEHIHRIVMPLSSDNARVARGRRNWRAPRPSRCRGTSKMIRTCRTGTVWGASSVAVTLASGPGAIVRRSVLHARDVAMACCRLTPHDVLVLGYSSAALDRWIFETSCADAGASARPGDRRHRRRHGYGAVERVGRRLLCSFRHS